MGSDPFFHWYVGAWGAVCAIALVLVLANPKAYSFATPAYLRFLGVPWKLVTFAIAGIGMTVVAPYTVDPTWDYYDAAFMSVLTFLTAPWATGTLYLALRGRSGMRQAYCCGTWTGGRAAARPFHSRRKAGPVSRPPPPSAASSGSRCHSW